MYIFRESEFSRVLHLSVRSICIFRQLPPDVSRFLATGAYIITTQLTLLVSTHTSSGFPPAATTAAASAAATASALLPPSPPPLSTAPPPSSSSTAAVRSLCQPPLSAAAVSPAALPPCRPRSGGPGRRRRRRRWRRLPIIIVNFSVRLMSIKCRFNCYLFKPFLEVWSPPETWSDRIDTYEENRNMGNSQDSQVFGDIARFPGILGILQISQIPVDSRFICMIFFTQIHCLSSVIFPWFVF